MNLLPTKNQLVKLTIIIVKWSPTIELSILPSYSYVTNVRVALKIGEMDPTHGL